MMSFGATGHAYAHGVARPWRRLRARALLPWAGLLLVLLLSSQTIDQPGRAPTQRNLNYGRLNREHTFGQTFVVEHDGLVAVRVLLFARSNNAGDEPVTLRLRYADGDLPDLATATLPLRALDRREMTTFSIPTLTFDFPPQAITTTLRIELEAPTLPPEAWITVMAGPDTYRDGQLFADGKAKPAVDLAFQPVYQSRWLDPLLPISRMAYGKRGVLSWPQLYALLAYGFGLLLYYALAQLWRVVHTAAMR
jgi:hypothetical protein